jgi:hypothetical protein
MSSVSASCRLWGHGDEESAAGEFSPGAGVASTRGTS